MNKEGEWCHIKFNLDHSLVENIIVVYKKVEKKFHWKRIFGKNF